MAAVTEEKAVMAAVTEEKAVPRDSADLDPLIEDTNAALQTGFKDEFSDELECEDNTEDNVLEAESNGDNDQANSNGDITDQAEDNSNGDDNDKADDEQNIDDDTMNDDVISAGSSNDEIIDEPIDDDIISGGAVEGMTVDEDQDTEGDDANDAEEIDAGDSLEETEFVEGGDGEETELIDDTMEDGDPLMDDTDNPLMDDTENGDPEVDPLMGEEEEDVNGLEYPKDETDVGEEGMEEGEEDDEEGDDQSGGGTKRKSEDGESSDVSVRKSSRIKIRNDNRKEKEASLLEGKSVHDKQQSRIKMLQRPSERPRQVSDDEGGGSGEEGADQSDDQEKEDDTVDSIETKTQTPLGDPSKPPGVGAARKIDLDFLVPFQFGWSREVVVRPVKSGPQQFDIFYWPPKDGPDYGARNREATRKRRSKVDIEKYFEEFKSKLLSVNNFTFVRRPLELNNEAYEIVRHSKPSLETRSDKRTRKATVRYKEVAEHEGLLSGDSSNEEADKGGDEIEEVTDFDQGLPLSLQVIQRTTPFREESKKRKKYPDRERCVTPPTAAEIGWTVLDDDPLGIYTDLGGRSSPATPPPLRAVRLTSHNTVTSFREKLNEIKEDLVDPLIRVKQGNKDIELKENLATHDTAIKKYKNMRVPSLPFSRNQLPNSKSGHGVPRLSQGGRPGGGRPVPGNRPVSTPGAVKVKLPILSTNGKRPSVELVMLTNGKYQPIKFTNNRQVTESIPKRLFDQANHMKKTLYQRSIQVPKIGTKPVFVAVNPSPQGYKPFIQNITRPQVLSSEQVSILVRPAQGGNAVLLNVPKHVAVKVKVGTTLSFSASSDLKYTVIDNKMHPPVGKRPSQPPQNQNRTPKGGSGRQMPNLPAGVSIRPISGATNGRSGGGNNVRRSVGSNSAAISVIQQRNNQAKPSRRSAPSAQTEDLTDFSPCSPFCPGVTGIPELECANCHSLFHPKCVGIPQSMVPQIRAQFQCKACRSRSGGSTIQVIELD